LLRAVTVLVVIFIAIHTVDNHLRRIFDKVGVTSRTGLALWSVKRGVVSSTV
jgi:DNA-binding CsgD family transcriptional regulator